MSIVLFVALLLVMLLGAVGSVALLSRRPPSFGGVCLIGLTVMAAFALVELEDRVANRDVARNEES